MFKRLHEARQVVRITVNGRDVSAGAGDTVAAALLLAGHQAFRRSMLSGAARGPYCAMGACFECLVSIDGQQGLQACLVPVRDGMMIETMAQAT
jgi:NADH dehydrogenase/NADH:ubiquinone oxidoreductase subunit G